MTIDEPLPPYRADEHPIEPPRALSVVHDYEEIAGELFDNVDEELIETKCIHWNIADFHNLNYKANGPKFEVGGHTWNLLLFPRGNDKGSKPSSGKASYASLYLQWHKPSNAADSDDNDELHACAQFAICLSSPKYPTNYVIQTAHHRFTEGENDWGFTRFVDLEHIHEGDQGTSRYPLLHGDQIRATAIVRVYKDSTGVLWHDFISYDSKKHINIVGIHNAGATGYLIVLLQLLFFTNYFRKIIYETPAKPNSVLAALQSLFYQLQSSSKAVATTELTRSFGWTSYDLFNPHDVVEMKEVLQNDLQRVNPTLESLYRRVFGIQYASGKYDFHFTLETDGIFTLRDSLSHHVFEKHNTIDQLPPVLHMQLKRSRYDLKKDRVEKINSRFVYPLEVDLDPFLGQYSDRSESHVYVLQSVIVHSGDITGAGKYYSYIRPTCKGKQWIKFCDDRVHPVKETEVLEGSYGGPPLDKPDAPQRHSNAYILSYVRKSRLEEMLPEVPVGDIPKNIASQAAKTCQYLSRQNVVVFNEKNFKTVTNQFGMYDAQLVEPLSYDKAKTTMGDLEKMIKDVLFSEDESKDRKQCRLWLLDRRQNGTVRPDYLVEFAKNNNKLADETLSRMVLNMSTAGPSIVFYAETPVGPPLKRSQMLLFIKYFDIETQTLRSVGHIIVDEDQLTSSICFAINIMGGVATNTELDLYEEVRSTLIDKMDPKQTLKQAEIQNGDIICAQKSLSSQELQKLKVKHHDVASFLLEVNKINTRNMA